jgi:hypothetical protein
MKQELERKQKRRERLLVILVIMAVSAIYFTLTYPIAKAIRAARQHQR